MKSFLYHNNWNTNTSSPFVCKTKEEGALIFSNQLKSFNRLFNVTKVLFVLYCV